MPDESPKDVPAPSATQVVLVTPLERRAARLLVKLDRLDGLETPRWVRDVARAKWVGQS